MGNPEKLMAQIFDLKSTGNIPGAAAHLPPGEDRRQPALVPTEAGAHMQDGKKGHHHHRAGTASGELFGPSGSSRFLLSGCAAVDKIQEVATAPAALPAAAPGGDVRREEPAAPADVKSTNSTQEQVVALKVSLHCKACTRKVKKHLAKMEAPQLFTKAFYYFLDGCSSLELAPFSPWILG
ncbi:hypothetical protein ZWY2020_057607 [Hordeum vulgare]|nr:hypothetical protein ZWY2020_057607 [Hordeum vulgare]